MRGAAHRGSPASPPASITLALLLALAWASPAWADPAASKNNEGNRLYNQKRYDDALKKYTDAQVSRPDASELHYNIGNVLFRKKEYDKAVEEYMRAQAAHDPVFRIVERPGVVALPGFAPTRQARVHALGVRRVEKFDQA